MQSNEFIKKQAVYEILDRMKRIRDRDTAGLIGDAVSACIRCVERNVIVARAADAVEVVRCGECIRKDICRTSNVWAVSPDDNWFCADGKRKDGDGDV